MFLILSLPEEGKFVCIEVNKNCSAHIPYQLLPHITGRDKQSVSTSINHCTCCNCACLWS